MIQTKKSIRTNSAVMMVICIVVGLILTFGPRYLFRAVSGENLSKVQAVFSSYEEDYMGEGISIGVHLDDGRTYLIDDDYFSDELTEKLSALSEGTSVTLDIQTETGYIVGMKTEDAVMIDHDETMRKIGKSMAFARWASYAAYGMAALSLVSVLFPKGKKKKRDA